MGRATIQDVARHARASAASVSNFLNRPERMSRELHTRIERAVDELGYVPHLPAQQLRRGRSQLVGVCVVDAADPFLASVVRAVEQRLDPQGMTALVASSHGSADRQRSLLGLFEQLRLDGVVVTPCDADLSTLHDLQRRGTAVVLVDAADPTGVLPSVTLDHVAGGRLAAQHLVDGGRRRLVAVPGPERVTQVADRLAGARGVATAHGVELRVVEVARLDLDEGRRIGADLAAQPASRRPDGVLAGNDVLAVGILQELLAAGVRVPQDVAIVGHDDVDLARTAAVPLTTVRQPTAEIAALTAQLVVAQGPVVGTTLVPELVVRASSGPAGS
ncbi:LacI family DNA-binding transcriptional regulator [Cellulomonas sp. S1-8]|uniref:LacI family DNA-binding transcriptional regulator n=1 Tax=Cellulomonas sp. S1-8 TaxID=2904790 RepID=UPI002244CC89|nr:LacI family DNA-binding transcriptional regulator [Cellulomonas sp. S1-8]UZN02990.1 LacI family transcriptional regulator [Cellulomonas sp. S1-8]